MVSNRIPTISDKKKRGAVPLIQGTAPQQLSFSKLLLHHWGMVPAQPSVWVTPQLALISPSGIG